MPALDLFGSTAGQFIERHTVQPGGRSPASPIAGGRGRRAAQGPSIKEQLSATARVFGSEFGQIIGIKGGAGGWARQTFGFGGGRSGLFAGMKRSFGEGGGLMGAMKSAGEWFGFGFKPGPMGPVGPDFAEHIMQNKGYYQRLGGGARMIGRAERIMAGKAIPGGALGRQRFQQEAGRLVGGAPGQFGARKWLGAGAGVAGLVGISSTVGLWNTALMAGGYFGGMAVGGGVERGIRAWQGTKMTGVGRRWGRRAGLAGMGLGLLLT